MFDPKLMECANELVKGCREETTDANLDKLYAENCICVEAASEPGRPGPEFSGLAAIKEKHDYWNTSAQMHSLNVDGPFFQGGDKFSVIFDMDVTMKDDGQRMQMREIGVYTAQNGQIVREEFFFAMPQA